MGLIRQGMRLGRKPATVIYQKFTEMYIYIYIYVYSIYIEVHEKVKYF